MALLFNNFIPQPVENPSGIFVIEDLHTPTRLVVKQDAQNGCGGLVWPAGKALANWILQKEQSTPGFLRDKSIIELGSGGGVVGLALALNLDLGNGHIVITDQKCMLPLMEANIALNHLQNSHITAAELDWGSDVPSHLQGADVVLAADCVYFEPAFDLLHNTLKRLVHRDTLCLMAYKKRRRADKRFFIKIRKDFELIPIKFPDVQREGVMLYQIHRKSQAQ